MHHEASQFWNRAGLWCLASILTGCVLLLLFRWFPQIDFAASNLFFSQVDCPPTRRRKTLRRLSVGIRFILEFHA